MPLPQIPDKSHLPDLDFNVPIGCAQGVVAYSNLDDYYFSGEKCFTPEGVYAGFSRQCVCYARRHMYSMYGCIFGQCGPAHEIFDMTEVDHVETGAKHPFIACKNGESTTKPTVGNTLIYPICKRMPVGHVAVISAVGDDWVGIAEENQESKSWLDFEFGRVIPLVKNAETGAWSIVETDPALVNCRGWMYIEGVDARKPLPDTTEEEVRTINEKSLHCKIYAPLKVLPQFIAPKQMPKTMARFATPVIAPGAPDHDKVPDERHDQVAEAEKGEGAENEQVKKQVLEIQVRRNAQKNLRNQAIVQYEKLVADRFQQEEVAGRGHHFLRPSEINNGQGHLGKISHPKRGDITVPFARSAVPHTTHWSSMFAASEELAIGSIGTIMRAYKVVEEAAIMFGNPKNADLVNGADQTALAQRFDMPPEALRATLLQIDKMAGSPSASTALSKLDFLVGTMSIVHDHDADHYKILHTEFDSLANLIEIHGMQEYYAKVQSGIKAGWFMTGFGNDVHRALRNFQRTRYGIWEADKPLVFLDFGRAEDLSAKLGIHLPKDALYHYQVERLQAEYLVEYLVEFLEDKQHDLAIGDLQPEDMINWTVTKVNFWDDKQVKIEAETGKVFFFNGKEFEEALVMWKMCPWSSIFALHYSAEAGETASASDAKLELFLNKVAYDVENPRVFQPLWAHVVGHPQFLPFLSRAAERMNESVPGVNGAIDNLKERLDGDSIAKYVIPVSAWSASAGAADSDHGLPKCSYKVPAFEGILNPDQFGDQEKKYSPPISDVPHRLREPSSFHPAIHSLIIGGKRSASCWIESRPVKQENGDNKEKHHDDDEDTSIWSVVLPASMAFMPMVFGRGK